MKGWVKIHRELADHWLWDAEPYTKSQAWIDLIIHANHADNEILIKSQVIKLKRGQQARSELTLSKRWKWSRNKVRRFLELLKNETMIEVKTNHLTSIITICNYSNFQDRETTDGTTKGTANGTAHDTSTEQHTEHRQECKEQKNDEEGNNKPANKFTDEDLTAANFIHGKVKEILPDMKEPNLNKWADTIRLMRERDNRTHKEICQVFLVANNDPFWQQNILSPEKLRKQFDRLKLINTRRTNNNIQEQIEKDKSREDFLKGSSTIQGDFIEGEFSHAGK